MRPVRHLGCGLLLAAVNYLVNGEADTSAACAAGAVLCDTDHLLEYAVYCAKHKKKPDFDEWYSGDYFKTKGTHKIIFHSWEACILMWILMIAGILSGKKPGVIRRVFKGFTVGYTSHLILDQMGNGFNSKGYFLFYRWRNGWKRKSLTVKTKNGTLNRKCGIKGKRA